MYRVGEAKLVADGFLREKGKGQECVNRKFH
jgi:hypothetical protein